MSKRRIKLALLSMLSIMLITCLVVFTFNFTYDTSTINSSNSEFTSVNTQSINTETIKSIAENKSLTAPKTLNTLQDTSKKTTEMVVMQRPKWKLSGSLITEFEQLKNAAENGDNKARYILAKNLSYCFNSPIDDTALDIKLTQVLDYSDSALTISRITAKYEYCAGIKQQQRTEFYNYSQAAANHGYVAAQEFIGTITPEFFMASQGYQNLEREDFITTRDNFLAQQIEFLQQAAQNGSIKALARLSGIGNSQKFGKNNGVKTAAFNQLILELTQSNEIYNRYAWFQEKLHQQLTPEEINNAFAMSEEWLAIIKTNGTLYLKGD